MKKRFVAFALIISTAVLSLTTGCMVQERHGRYHHDGYHNGYNNGHYDHGHYDHDGGYNHGN